MHTAWTRLQTPVIGLRGLPPALCCLPCTMEKILAVESAAGEAPAAPAPEPKEETLEEVLSRHRLVVSSVPPAVDWGDPFSPRFPFNLFRVVRLARKKKKRLVHYEEKIDFPPSAVAGSCLGFKL